MILHCVLSVVRAFSFIFLLSLLLVLCLALVLVLVLILPLLFSARCVGGDAIAAAVAVLVFLGHFFFFFMFLGHFFFFLQWEDEVDPWTDPVPSQG